MPTDDHQQPCAPSGPPNLPGWPRALRLDWACAYVALARSTWLREVAEGRAPRPVTLTAGRVAWLRDDLDVWLEAKAAQDSTEGNPWD